MNVPAVHEQNARRLAVLGHALNLLRANGSPGYSTCQTLDVSHVSFELLLPVAARVLSSDNEVPQQKGCRITELMSQVCFVVKQFRLFMTHMNHHLCTTLQVQARQDSPQLCQH